MGTRSNWPVDYALKLHGPSLPEEKNSRPQSFGEAYVGSFGIGQLAARHFCRLEHRFQSSEPLGIAAVTIGGSGERGNWHSRNGWHRQVNTWHGPQNALDLVFRHARGGRQ